MLEFQTFFNIKFINNEKKCIKRKRLNAKQIRILYNKSGCNSSKSYNLQEFNIQ